MRWLAVIVAVLALSACAPEPEGGVNLDGEPDCTVVSNGKPACGGADE